MKFFSGVIMSVFLIEAQDSDLKEDEKKSYEGTRPRGNCHISSPTGSTLFNLKNLNTFRFKC